MDKRLKYWVNTLALAGIVGALGYAGSFILGASHIWPGVIVGICAITLVRSAGAPR